MHHHQAAAVERTETSLTQVGSEDVQFRPYRQLEQTGVSIEILLVVVFQEPSSRQFAIGKPQEPAWPVQEEAQRKATDNPIADIETQEREQLGGGRVELAARAIVAVPVEDQVSGDDTST